MEPYMKQNERERNFVNFIEITDKKWRKKD